MLTLISTVYGAKGSVVALFLLLKPRTQRHQKPTWYTVALVTECCFFAYTIDTRVRFALVEDDFTFTSGNVNWTCALPICVNIGICNGDIAQCQVANTDQNKEQQPKKNFCNKPRSHA